MNEVIRKDDRRLFERFVARFPAKFKDDRYKHGEKVYLRDASAFGAQIVCKERLFLHDKVALEVQLPDGQSPMSLRGEVVWAKKATPRIWDIGVKFHKIELLRMARLYKFGLPESNN